MPDYLAYYRVSTDRQGESGLGLDAQRQAVASYIGSGQHVAEFTEIESGKRHTNRPQLAAALAECRRRATLESPNSIAAVRIFVIEARQK